MFENDELGNENLNANNGLADGIADDGSQDNGVDDKENSDTDLGDKEKNTDDAGKEKTDNTENKNTGKEKDGADDKGIYGAPDVYDYKDVKLPENLEYDKDMLKEFNALNKETNLSQAQANKYMEFGIKLAQKQGADLPNILEQVQQAKVAQFKQAMNTDAELGNGDKAKMNAYLDVADKGYVAFANDEVKAALADTGLNYHPAIIKMFHRLGELVGDDKIYSTKAPTGGTDTASILYGN